MDLLQDSLKGNSQSGAVKYHSAYQSGICTGTFQNTRGLWVWISKFEECLWSECESEYVASPHTRISPAWEFMIQVGRNLARDVIWAQLWQLGVIDWKL